MHCASPHQSMIVCRWPYIVPMNIFLEFYVMECYLLQCWWWWFWWECWQWNSNQRQWAAELEAKQEEQSDACHTLTLSSSISYFYRYHPYPNHHRYPILSLSSRGLLGIRPSGIVGRVTSHGNTPCLAPVALGSVELCKNWWNRARIPTF